MSIDYIFFIFKKNKNIYYNKVRKIIKERKMAVLDNEIIIYNTKIVICNYKVSNYRKLLNALSVWQETKYGGLYVSWAAYIEDEEENKLYIHKGIKLSYLMKFYPNHIIKYDTQGNPFKNINNITLKVNPRSEIQEKSIDYLLGIDEFENVKNDTQKFLALKPGTGKTYCAINYICKIKRIPIIIVDNDKILNQWKDSFLKFTDISEKDIFVISGSNTIRKLMKETNNPYKIYLASHRTLDSYSQNDLTLLDNLFSKIGIGVKIFDEAHVEWKNIFNIDMYTNIKNTVYLTATPSRSNPSEKKVYNNLFSDVPVYGLEESKNNKYIRYVNVLWNSHPTQNQSIKMNNNYGFDSNAYNEYLLNLKQNDFLDVINNLISSLWIKNNNYKIAIVVNCNNMVSMLYNYYKNSSIAEGKSIGMFCGLIPDKKLREKELEKNLIITTLKGFNKGVDVDGLNIVINTVSISSNVLMEQLSGRLRYKDGSKKYFIQLTDKGFFQCMGHNKIRNKFMTKICSKYIELDLTS